MNKKGFLNMFKLAEVYNIDYIGVKIVCFGKPEVIIFPNKNFEQKYKYYNESYNEKLVSINNSNIYIESIAYGRNFSDIQQILNF